MTEQQRERDIAEMEAQMAHDTDQYFNARPQIMRTRDKETTFEAGFKAAWKARALSHAEGEAVGVVIDRLRGQLKNCINHLERAKNRAPGDTGEKYRHCIERANAVLSDTLDCGQFGRHVPGGKRCACVFSEQGEPIQECLYHRYPAAHPAPQVAVPEKVRELIGAVRSVNRSRQHSIHIEGDDEPCFWQRAEWVRYVLELADEAEQTITAAPTAPAREPISSDDLVPVPRGLLGAARSAIRRTGPSDKVLAELRRYTTGDLSRPTAPAGEKLTPYEHRVNGWMMECFGPEISSDIEERNHRFLEESLELVQSTGCTAEAAHRLVDYVFGRPVGEPFQEVGGVRVTLAALCLANGINGEAAAEAELARITQPEMVERIREKQKRKPAFGPLPGVYPERAEQSAGDPDGLPENPRPMSTAPRDGAMVRLLVQFTENGVNDGFDSGPGWTIGTNTHDDSGDDEWYIAGWDWRQDCFTVGEGEPLGWLPMLSAPAPDEREPRLIGYTSKHEMAFQGSNPAPALNACSRGEFNIPVYAHAAPDEREIAELREDAERYRWLCDGNGYFLEEEMLCGYENQKQAADRAIDAERLRVGKEVSGHE